VGAAGRGRQGREQPRPRLAAPQAPHARDRPRDGELRRRRRADAIPRLDLGPLGRGGDRWDYREHRAYHAALARATDPAAGLGYTPRRVLRALRQAGLDQTPETLQVHVPGVTPTTRTVRDALGELEAAGLAAQSPAGDGAELFWSACEPPRADTFANLKLRGPHDLRHTFSTWLEDAGIPARVIDELMGHSGGRRGTRDGSAIGLRYRHTTPEMEARAVAALEARLDVALKIATQADR
jgi:hypothetical protein